MLHSNITLSLNYLVYTFFLLVSWDKRHNHCRLPTVLLQLRFPTSPPIYGDAADLYQTSHQHGGVAIKTSRSSKICYPNKKFTVLGWSASSADKSMYLIFYFFLTLRVVWRCNEYRHQAIQRADRHTTKTKKRAKANAEHGCYFQKSRSEVQDPAEHLRADGDHWPHSAAKWSFKGRAWGQRPPVGQVGRTGTIKAQKQLIQIKRSITRIMTFRVLRYS